MIQPITSSDTIRTTYSGGTGCACGCRGTYAETGRAVTMRVNKINRNLDKVEVWKGMADETIYELESDNDRVVRVYVVKAA